MKKVVLTGAMLVVAASCDLGEQVAKEKQVIDKSLCWIEYDYKEGLFKLKNPKNSMVTEFNIEVQLAGEQFTDMHLKQTGSNEWHQMDSLQVDDPVEIAEDELLMQQEELEKLVAELAEAEGSAEKLEAQLMELERRWKAKDPLGDQYDAAEKKVMNDLMHNSIPRDLLLKAAELSATAQASGKQLHKIADKVVEGVNAGAEDMDAGVKKLYDSIEAIQAKTAAQEQAKIALHNAVAELKLATHGLPDTLLFGRKGDTSVWISLRDGDIWGVDLKEDGEVYSFNPLKSTGERLTRIFETRPNRPKCSRSESDITPINTPTPTPT